MEFIAPKIILIISDSGKIDNVMNLDHHGTIPKTIFINVKKIISETFFFDRITLKTLHSFVKVPKFNAEQLNDADDLDEIEFYNFLWQQKEFSKSEIKWYSKLENCKNDREKDYHKKITEDNRYLDETGEVCYTGKIFSYVNDDEFHERGTEHSELANFVERFGQWQNNSEFGKENF